jgi:hypothetical protein
LASGVKYFEGLVAELRRQNSHLIHVKGEDQSRLLALRDPPDGFIRDSPLVTLCNQDQPT